MSEHYYEIRWAWTSARMGARETYGREDRERALQEAYRKSRDLEVRVTVVEVTKDKNHSETIVVWDSATDPLPRFEVPKRKRPSELAEEEAEA